MFEIGSSLRAARERQQLQLSDVEQATRIRSKYLAALEDERFDVLPGTAYAKGFLRTYADFLGLDGPRFVDEFNERFAPEEPEAAPPVRVRRPRRLLDARLVVIPLAVGIGLFAWRLTGGGGHEHARPATPPHPAPAATTTGAVRASTKTARPKLARVVLIAARGACWLSVRLGSETGRPIYEQMLEPGQTARFVGTRFWIRIGAPWNVDVTLNGGRAQLPASTGNVVVTARGLQRISG